MSRPAFRRLLRLARLFDRQPVLQLGLVGRPPRKYDWHSNRAVRTRFAGSPFEEAMIWEAIGFSTEFAMPSRLDGAVARACRRHFRRTMAMGLPYQSEAGNLQRRLEDGKKMIESLGDWHPDEMPSQLLKSFDSGGHQQVQRGDLLLAHPMSCIRCPNFDQALILIYELENDGVAGLVVNKPLRNISLQQLLSQAKTPEDKEWANSMQWHSALEKLQVFRGGPIIVGGSLQKNLHWLHCFSTIPGAQEVAPGLWMGGDVNQILSRVAQNQFDGPLVRLCFGHAAWDPLQLRLELESGVWARARPVEEAGDGLSVSASACLDDAFEKTWQRTMLLAGLPELANFPRNAPTDAKLQSHISQQGKKTKADEAATKDGRSKVDTK